MTNIYHGIIHATRENSMAVLESPDDLKEYCLRRLGKPVINIEVDDTQLNDRIDDAIEKFVMQHYNGSTEVYKLHVITAKEVQLGYIVPDSKMTAIIEVLDTDNGVAGSSVEEFERMNFRLAQTDIFDRLMKGGVSEHYLKFQHYSLFTDILSPDRSFQYNPIKAYLNISGQLLAGNVIILHGYENINAENDVLVYNDLWVKQYTTALFKRVQLPGGVTMNGQILFDEAQAEIEKLDTEFSLKYELPVDFFMGPSFI